MAKYEHKIVSGTSAPELEKKLTGLGAEGWRAINYVAVYVPNAPGLATSGAVMSSVLLEREL